MMKKCNIITLLLLAAFQLAFAAPVSQTTALLTAKQFLAKRGVYLPSIPSIKAVIPPKGMTNTKAVPYYIFNISGNKGYVVVSGDDRTRQILGYSDKGSLDFATMSQQIKSFLQGYATEISELDKLNQEIGNTKSLGKITTRKTIRPIVKCHWGQDDPYNYFCPEVASKEKTVTGCVATAMAQVMFSHQWPAATTEEIPGYDTRTQANDHLSIEKIAKNSPIEWDKIKATYGTNEELETKKAIGNLMKYIGASLRMNYDIASTGGSGAWPTYIAPAFNKYFNYNAITIQRSSVPLKIFEDILYKEMEASRPVVFCGTVLGGGGHCFVIDGYDGNGFFHVNWGWDGMSDGYFLISVLDPGSTSGIGASSSAGGYAAYQYATIGIAKNFTGKNPSLSVLTDVKDASDATVSAHFFNYYHDGDLYKMALAYLKDNGELEIISNETTKYIPSTADGIQPMTISLVDKLEANKSYRVFPIIRKRDANEWSYNKYSFATVIKDSNGKITAVPINNKNRKDLKIVDMKLDPNQAKIVGVPTDIEITLKNDGKYEYHGICSIQTAPKDKLNKAKICSSLVVTLQPGETKTYKAMCSYVVQGTNSIYFTDDFGYLIDTHLNVDGVKSKVINNNLAVDYNLNDLEDDGKTIVSRKISGTVTLSTTDGKELANQILLVVLKGNNIIGKKIIAADIPAGQKQIVPFDIDITNSGNYTLAMVYISNRQLRIFDNTLHNVKLSLPVLLYMNDGTIKEHKARTGLKVKKDVLAVDYTGNGYDDIDIIPNDNPNTLYFGKRKQKGIKGKNFVKINSYGEPVADEINIEDGKEFFSPMIFTAKKITYKRKFDKVVTATTGWETIVLPFSPVKIEAQGKPIAWYTNKDDKGKDFFLMEYDSETGNDVYFLYPKSFDKNVPYLIGIPKNLQGNDIVFTGENQKIYSSISCKTHGELYNFVGTYVAVNQGKLFSLNQDGNEFVLVNSVSPFRAYFETTDNNAPDNIKFHISGSATSLDNIEFGNNKFKSANVYDIQGRKIATVNSIKELNNLPKGLYIISGKKILVK